MAENRRVALITGGGTGVGAATATALAARGWNVAVNYSRSAAEAEATAEACRALGVEAETLAGDVGDDAACRRMVADTAGRWGRLDALVNSAGTTQFVPIRDFDRQNAEDFERVNRVNVIGPWQAARTAEPWLRRSSGCVVNVSSIAAVSGAGSSLAYIASKGALNSLTLALARLMAPEVRVNAVLPGLIDTRWFADGLGADALARIKENFAAASALETVCTAEDVARSVVFLVEDAPKTTGHLLTVDGGSLLGRAPKPLE